MDFSKNDFVLAELDQNNSSHIYYLNQSLKKYVDDFVEGYNAWEINKAELINKMASTLEKLHMMGEYPNPITTISGHIRKILAEKGVSQGQLDYVTEVLPSKYKNPNQIRDIKRMENPPNSSVDSIEAPPPIVNMYDLGRKLRNYSPTELQNYYADLEQRHKHIRNNLKTEKETAECIAIEKKIQLPRYKKESSKVPPTHLQGPSALFYELEQSEAIVSDILKYLQDVKKSVYEFPPDAKLAEECAADLRTFNNGVLKTIKEILIPYTDKKFSGDWPKWFEINITKLEQSKNYAGSKHALETGEYATKLDKEGNPVILSLDRGITREQVGDREPEIYRMAINTLMTNGMVKALHNWSYNTFIMEEYDT
ncbi:MAG TPA: hypothetical protein VFM31_11025, partial [Nitrososphaeraceae archaeon]|nr:hypothetical protein [Nitrososphaeraceae archaeon]